MTEKKLKQWLEKYLDNSSLIKAYLKSGLKDKILEAEIKRRNKNYDK